MYVDEFLTLYYVETHSLASPMMFVHTASEKERHGKKSKQVYGFVGALLSPGEGDGKRRRRVMARTA